MQVSWEEVKSKALSKNINLQYTQDINRYTINLYENTQILFCFIQITNPRNSEQIDFEDNFKVSSNSPLVTRTKSIIENEVIQGSINVTSTETIEAKVGASRLNGRRGIIITPVTRTIYWGGTDTVTSNTGTPILKNQSQFIAIGDVPIYLIASLGSDVDVRIVEVS